MTIYCQTNQIYRLKKDQMGNLPTIQSPLKILNTCICIIPNNPEKFFRKLNLLSFSIIYFITHNTVKSVPFENLT